MTPLRRFVAPPPGGRNPEAGFAPSPLWERGWGEGQPYHKEYAPAMNDTSI